MTTDDSTTTPDALPPVRSKPLLAVCDICGTTAPLHKSHPYGPGDTARFMCSGCHAPSPHNIVEANKSVTVAAPAAGDA